MEDTEYQVVVSWTDADDKDAACYCVALYCGGDETNPRQFHIVEDNDDEATRAAIVEAIDALKADAEITGLIDVEWDV